MKSQAIFIEQDFINLECGHNMEKTIGAFVLLLISRD